MSSGLSGPLHLALYQQWVNVYRQELLLAWQMQLPPPPPPPLPPLLQSLWPPIFPPGEPPINHFMPQLPPPPPMPEPLLVPEPLLMPEPLPEQEVVVVIDDDEEEEYEQEREEEGAGERLVQLVDYATRRDQLISANKPYYVYSPTILQNWTEADYMRHKLMLAQEEAAQSVRFSTEEDENQVSSTKSRRVTLVGLRTSSLKRHMSPTQRADRWWLVVDTKVLLDDLKFVDRLVRSDRECRMRIPYEVLHDLTAMTSPSSRRWARIPARRVTRYILRHTGRDKPAVGQTAMDAEDLLDTPVATDSIVNCCLQQARDFFYVVLISDDPERRARALSAGVPAYSLDQVKSLAMVNVSSNKLGYHLALTRSFEDTEDDGE